jgi:signal transduction histidine kinase
MMKTKIKINMATKIMLFTGALVLSILICQIVFSLFFSRSFLIDYKKTSAEGLFDALKANYSDDVDKIYTITRRAEEDNINILVFSDARFIYSNRNIDIPTIRRALIEISPFGQTVFTDRPKALVMAVPRSDIEMIALNGRFEYEGEPRYVAIETPVESIEISVKILSRANMIIAVAVLIAGVICAFIFSRRFSKPIQGIQAVAQNVAALKFDVKADEDLSTTELSRLSASINTMAGELEAMIGDLKEKNESLQDDIDKQLRLDKMRREFVANVSHEFKTPLCLLQLYSENLKNNIEAVDKDFYCDTIIEEVGKLDSMAKSLLDLSSIENGLSGMKLAPVDFSAFCEKTLSAAEVLFASVSAEISIEEGARVMGDCHYLEQAIKNYVTNALSHTSPGGRLSISLRKAGGGAIFSVFNEGAPIDPADADQIWESFYKADKARVRGEESHAGLGLYIVKTILNAHGGAYGLINQEGGVLFWFSLPLISQKALID